jgi:CubicO group peptidase (beta-lactamase class C family)
MTRAGGPAGSTPCSTVEDMLKFARMHVDGGAAPGGKRALSEASVRAMQEPQVKLPVAYGDNAAQWGLGWMLFDWSGRRVIGHDGGTIGQQSSLRILPEERFAVAVLTNSVGGGLLASRIMRWLYGQRMGIELPERAKPPETPPEFDLSRYEGVYERLGFRTTISRGENGLTQETVNTRPLSEGFQLPPAPMFAVDESVFLQRDPWGLYQPVVFSEFEGGRPRYLYMGRVARRAEDPAG